MNLPMPAEKLLPHRGKMLLIDTVLNAEDGAGTVIAIPDRQSISCDPGGKMLAPFYLELVAQAYAAVCGYHFLSNNLPIPLGFLVGVQRFELYPENNHETVSESPELTISVNTCGEFEGFAVVEGIVSRNGKVVAEGKIKLFVPQEELERELPGPLKKQETSAQCPL